MLKISLAAARVNARKTQKEVAAELGKSVSTVKSWENGRTSPDVVSFLKLCTLYGVPAECILLEKE